MAALLRNSVYLSSPLASLASSPVAVVGVRAGAAAAVASVGAVRHATYKAPQKDISFVMNDVLKAPAHYEKLGYTDCNADLITNIVEEISKFSESVLLPLDSTGDKEGCTLKNNTVTAPKGFREAYDQYRAGGWQSVTVPADYGGQGLPLSLGLLKSEIVGSCNWAWGMYPGLSIGAMNTLLLHASEQQKQEYLTKLASGEWSGTMCLTEPQCGTDLSLVETRAERQADGTFKLSGTKIFISAGDHDLTPNIVHIVLARIDGAPKGLKGISLFLVPKFLNEKDGSLSSVKNLVCSRLENKMGIHGSPTCEMRFDGSVGYLIGKENNGLHQMFTFMNTARIGTALQGLGTSERALQGALAYAQDRLAMRSLTGAKYPEKKADPILVHPDVRKNLLICKAYAEGGRAMVYHTALMADFMIASKSDEERRRHDDYLGFFTPILKGFLTETGIETANLGMQVWGGHGYIKENGMEQISRDHRIATMYEGTTGVQALDLLGRKVLLNSGANLFKFSKEIYAYCSSLLYSSFATSIHKTEALYLMALTTQWLYLSARLAVSARINKDFVGSASVDYLMYSGHVTMAYMWLRMMETAGQKLKAARGEGSDSTTTTSASKSNATSSSNANTLSEEEVRMYKAKIQTGKFFFSHLLPRTRSLASTMVAPPSKMMSMKDEEWAAR